MNPPKYDRKISLPTGIVLAWVACLAALGLATWAGELVQAQFGITERLRQGVHALIMSGMVLPGIWWLRTRVDRLSIAGLGFSNVRTSLVQLAKGAGLIIVPMLLTLGATFVFGWAAISVDFTAAGLGALAAGVATALFFEAIPEETVFRGYIYSNLSTVYRRWVAGAVTVGLFVLLPTVLVLVQKYVLGMDISLGGADHVTPEYVITLFLFGSFVQYLRIQSESIWTSIGFHAMFVLVGRIMSPRPGSFIQFTEVSADQSIQMVLLGTLLLSVIAAVVYPRLAEWHGGRAGQTIGQSKGATTG